MFSILSWNIRQGGGSRTRQIIKALVKQASDVVVLSEFRNNENGNLLRGELLRYGWKYQFSGGADKEVNSVLIASKVLCSFSHLTKEESNFPHNVLCAHFEAFDIYGMYLPHKKKHSWLDYLKQVEGPSIMVGDFNTGINGMDQKGNSFWYEDDLKFMLDTNFRDAFREKNGDVKEYSWYSPQGNGYRYDHSYVHATILPVVSTCYYIHEWREEGMSDHSPMVLELAG